MLVDAPRAPSYELAEQAGARLVHSPRGYLPRTDRGKIRDGVWIVGEAAGTPLRVTEMALEAEAIVASAAR